MPPRASTLTKHFVAFVMDESDSFWVSYTLCKSGHMSIENTLIYALLSEFGNAEYVSKVAKNAEEAKRFTEGGFGHECTTPENLILFKIQKWKSGLGESKNGPGEI